MFIDLLIINPFTCFIRFTTFGKFLIPLTQPLTLIILLPTRYTICIFGSLFIFLSCLSFVSNKLSFVPQRMGLISSPHFALL